MLCQTASVSSNCDLRSRLLFCLISFNFFCNVLVRIKVPSPYMFLTQNIWWEPEILGISYLIAYANSVTYNIDFDSSLYCCGELGAAERQNLYVGLETIW